MELEVSEKIFERFPGTRIGVVIASNVSNNGIDEAAIKLLENVELETRSKFDINTLIENPSIAVWRAVYNNFGSKPRDYRPSIEALIRSILNGRGIRHINKLVDIYNYISLRHVVPVGGEDLDKTEGNLYLKFSSGNEKFLALGSDKEDNPYDGEVIYCDGGNNVLCRRWNWRESDRTKLTNDTKNAIIVIEGFDEKVDAALEELSGLVEKFCGSENRIFLIDKNNPKIEW